MPTINETILAAATGSTLPTKSDLRAEADAAVAGKPIPAKPAASKRVVKLAKPASAKPAAKPVASKPAAKPATVPAGAKPAKPAGNITRTAATIDAARTNFGELSDRDASYLAFYASFAKRSNGIVRLADIVASGKRPAYNGSNKPHDAGVVVRLAKAGLIVTRDNGNSFTFTKRGTERREYASAKAA